MDTLIIRKCKPWTRDANGRRVDLPARWFLFVLDRSGEYAPASAMHAATRGELIGQLAAN